MTDAPRVPRKQMKVGLLGEGLLDWGGGIDILRLILGALAKRSEEMRLELLVTRLPPRTPPLFRALDELRRPAPGGLPTRLRRSYWAAKSRSPAHDQRADVLDLLRRTGTAFAVREFSGPAGLRAAVCAGGIDVVLPSTQDLGSDFPVPWVGYLPDIQHRHLPHMFEPDECAGRDRLFGSIVDHADALIVTSAAVGRDVKDFYGRTRDVVSLPFAALPPADAVDQQAPPGATAARHGVRGRYFIVCNQFWKHKAHGVAFQALQALRRQPGCEDVELVCTGSTSDYRNPGYFDQLQQQLVDSGLRDAVKILGRVPKHEQLLLVRDSVALLQPSLFEGTQGGLAVADALSLGVRVIVSDIPVNAELREPLVQFFATGSAPAMAEAMKRMLGDPPPAIDPHALSRAAHTRLSAYAEGLAAACLAATHARAESRSVA